MTNVLGVTDLRATAFLACLEAMSTTRLLFGLMYAIFRPNLAGAPLTTALTLVTNEQCTDSQITQDYIYSFYFSSFLMSTSS
ncbi:hypothetical protein TSMEX_006466 [Taenia solium]